MIELSALRIQVLPMILDDSICIATSLNCTFLLSISSNKNDDINFLRAKFFASGILSNNSITLSLMILFIPKGWVWWLELQSSAFLLFYSNFSSGRVAF